MTTPVAAAAEAVAQRLPRRFGNKQIFLPNHIVAFIRPKPKQPPNLATFIVPLQFNKLDLRDYLFHAYNVDVTSVRSFINQPEPRKKGGHLGSWYRPRSQKMMIVELVKPFVWPQPLAEEDREAFDYDMFTKLNKTRETNMKMQMNPSDIPLRTQVPEPRERKLLKEQAEEYLKSGEWKSGAGVSKWTEVEKDLDV